MSLNVLLLDAHTVQSISVARSLHEIGCNVHGLIEKRLSYGYVSRYIDKKVIAPVLLDDLNKYYTFLCDYLSFNQIDLIIPLYNDSAELLSKYKKNIESKYHSICAIPEYNTFIQAHNKEMLMNICRDYSFPHPRTSHLSINNLQDASLYVGFPALIKPNISSGARGIVFVRNQEELEEKFLLIERTFGSCTLQEYIDHTGIYYNVMLYRDKKGKFRESVVIKIMRYFPLKGGTSCYCEVVNNSYLIEVCQRVLNVLDWNGFADFDIMESKTGEFKIIEINPRVPASIHAAYIAGINYPEIMIHDMLDCKQKTYPLCVGKSIRFFGLDVMWFLFSPSRFLFRPSWFKFFGKNIYYQDGSLKDPFPMFMGIIYGIIKYLNPSFRKSKLDC